MAITRDATKRTPPKPAFKLARFISDDSDSDYALASLSKKPKTNYLAQYTRTHTMSPSSTQVQTPISASATTTPVSQTATPPFQTTPSTISQPSSVAPHNQPTVTKSASQLTPVERTLYRTKLYDFLSKLSTRLEHLSQTQASLDQIDEVRGKQEAVVQKLKELRDADVAEEEEAEVLLLVPGFV